MSDCNNNVSSPQTVPVGSFWSPKRSGEEESNNAKRAKNRQIIRVVSATDDQVCYYFIGSGSAVNNARSHKAFLRCFEKI
jgi:hypothetical protein